MKFDKTTIHNGLVSSEIINLSIFGEPSNLEKLVKILHANQIDFNEYIIKFQDIESIEYINNNVPVEDYVPINTGGPFRVGDTVGSLLYIW